jgi:hypothetical protein
MDGSYGEPLINLKEGAKEKGVIFLVDSWASQ